MFRLLNTLITGGHIQSNVAWHAIFSGNHFATLQLMRERQFVHKY